jgi:hypothetical protein
MIQCSTVRAIAIACGIACAAGHAAAAPAPAGTVAIYWQPPGEPPPGDTVRTAFTGAVRPLTARLIDASQPVPGAISLAPELEAAKADYARFAFPDAITRLDALQRSADAHGGGDLDARQLSEIFLYRGLSRLETGAADAAWDDLVRAARLDLARIMDPASFPPRAVNAYKRAVAEAAQLPQVELEVKAPADAVVRVDGAPIAGVAGVMLGQHFIAVSAEGYEPWAGVVSVAGVHQRFVPPLRAYRSPDGDRLLALANDPTARRLLLGALERTATGWRFVARDITLPDGKFTTETITLGEAPAAPAIEALVRRLSPQGQVRGKSSPTRWWIWAAAGAVVATATITVIALSSSEQPSVAGDVDFLNP